MSVNERKQSSTIKKLLRGAALLLLGILAAYVVTTVLF